MKCLFFSDVVKVVNLQGKLKSNKKQASELFFDFPINNIGRLESEVETYKVGYKFWKKKVPKYFQFTQKFSTKAHQKSHVFSKNFIAFFIVAYCENYKIDILLDWEQGSTPLYMYISTIYI